VAEHDTDGENAPMETGHSNGNGEVCSGDNEIQVKISTNEDV
jgi:hypothetical protein